MAKGGFPFGKKAAFERSGRDVEPKGMKEGSAAEEALDRRQMRGRVGTKTAPSVATPSPQVFKRGGKARRK